MLISLFTSRSPDATLCTLFSQQAGFDRHGHFLCTIHFRLGFYHVMGAQLRPEYVLILSARLDILTNTRITATAHPFPSATVCYASGIHPSFYAFWIPMLAFETLLCLLALIRGFQTFHKEGSLFQSGRHLVHILIRDSVLYFLVWVKNLLVSGSGYLIFIRVQDVCNVFHQFYDLGCC